MRRLIISTLILLLTSIEVHAQAAADSPEQKLAEEWIKRLNALDDWCLSVDGKEEGIEPVVDSMMELYSPNVVAEVPPHDKDQLRFRSSASGRRVKIAEDLRRQELFSYSMGRMEKSAGSVCCWERSTRSCPYKQGGS